MASEEQDHGPIYLPDDIEAGKFGPSEVTTGDISDTFRHRRYWTMKLITLLTLLLMSICYVFALIIERPAFVPTFNGDTNLQPTTATKQTSEIISVDVPTTDYGVAAVYSVDLVPGIEFANSWNKPYRGFYKAPPLDVVGPFNKVRLNFTISTYGKQFDRLAHLFVGGNELWRLSTAEPGNRDIIFTATKDVNRYASLFTEDQPVEFYLNNIVDDTYTGPINVTLKAEFFWVNESTSGADIYDWPVDKSATKFTSLTGGKLSLIPKPLPPMTIDVLPRNTTRAVIEVYATGNSYEEFWYSHITEPYSEIYCPHLDIGKYGPSREGEVYVNGRLAGGFVPFPVIYTGGYSPYLWSPIVGVHAYNVPSYLIDITPFLPQLWENQSDITINILNRFQDQLEQDWIVSANLLTWQNGSLYGSGFYSTDEPPKNAKTKLILPGADTLMEVMSTTSVVSNKAQLRWQLEWASEEGEDGDVQLLINYGFNQSWSLSKVQQLRSDPSEESQQLVHTGSMKSTVVIDYLVNNTNTDISASFSSYPEVGRSTELQASSTGNLVYAFNYSETANLYGISLVQSGTDLNSVDGYALSRVSRAVNGTSIFALSGRSASGAGAATTGRVCRDDLQRREHYCRRVDAFNGSIVFENTTGQQRPQQLQYGSSGSSLAKLNLGHLANWVPGVTSDLLSEEDQDDYIFDSLDLSANHFVLRDDSSTQLVDNGLLAPRLRRERNE